MGLREGMDEGDSENSSFIKRALRSIKDGLEKALTGEELDESERFSLFRGTPTMRTLGVLSEKAKGEEVPSDDSITRSLSVKSNSSGLTPHAPVVYKWAMDLNQMNGLNGITSEDIKEDKIIFGEKREETHIKGILKDEATDFFLSGKNPKNHKLFKEYKDVLTSVDTEFTSSETSPLTHEKKSGHKESKPRKNGERKPHPDPGARYVMKHLKKKQMSRSQQGLRKKFDPRIRPTNSLNESRNSVFKRTRFAREWDNTIRIVTEQSEQLKHYVNLDKISGHTWSAFIQEEKKIVGGVKPVWNISYDVEKERLVYKNNVTLRTSSLEPRQYPLAEKWEECVRKNGDTFYINALDSSKRRGTMTPGAFVSRGDRKVEQVIFRLHSSFPKNIIAVQEPPFHIEKVGWGTFVLRMELHFAEHYLPRVIPVHHELSFKYAEINSLVEVSLLDTRTGELEKFYVRFGNSHSHVEVKASKGDERAARIIKERQERLNLFERQLEFGNKLTKASDYMQKFIESSRNKRMALGSIMAAALDNKSDLLDTSSFPYFYNTAKTRLRYIVLDEETLTAGFETLLIKGNLTGNKLPISLSKPCKEGEFIDRFVSHCWLDNLDAKFDALVRFSRYFKEQNGRLPRLWIDMFCINQEPTELNMNLRCLPVFLMSCDKILCLRSPRLLNRMWCLTELYTYWVLSSPEENETESAIEWMDAEPDGSSFMDKRVNIKEAQCSLEGDATALLSQLKRCPGGISKVQQNIEEALRNAEKLDL